MLRCRNVCACSTLATRLVSNRGSMLWGRLSGSFLAQKITGNGSECRRISTSSFDKRSPDGGGRATRLRPDSRPRTPSLKTTGYLKPGGKEEELVEADLVGDSGIGVEGKLKPEEKRVWRPTVSKKAIDIELEWARDRVVLSKRVAQILNKGDLEKAVALVRTAQSRGYDCMVAWNELFDHEMKNDRPVAAFKLYNDMKKRGRKPNSYTYTIMFRGLARSSSQKSVQIALSIYKSLCSPNSGVKPSVLHVNAVLGVCSRHGNMDALWEVAGSLPERGDGAPDSRTFTIVLNGLQAHTANETKNLNPRSQVDGIAEKKALAVREGKRIWADVVRRWRAGDFIVDQPLVSAMGRLLLFGRRKRDCLDVFALLHQTMDVPLLEGVGTQLEALRTREQNKMTAQELAEGKQESSAESPELERVSMGNDEMNRALKEEPEPLPEKQELASEELGLPAEEVEQLNEEPEPLSETEEFKYLFKPVDLSQIHKNVQTRTRTKSRRLQITLPTPTNDELSLVLSACRTTPNGIAIGRAYWELFTSGPKQSMIKPDTHSFHEYLRLLRVARSSTEALRIIKNMLPRPDMVARKTFVIAISCCSRDRKNPHVLETAGELIGLMDTALMQPEPEILSKYLELVRYGISEESIRESVPILARVSDTKTSDMVFKTRILNAIDALRPQVDKLISLLAYATLSKHGKDAGEGERVKAASDRVSEGCWPFSRPYLPSFEESVYILKQAKQLNELARKEKTLSAEERSVLETENKRLKDILSPNR
ncbi:pentatricopeptide repeat protein [Histoplasma ohiense]|nr:pentatricopeptide repeat protein [Histoplasma ohiense (nom. inval.)]